METPKSLEWMVKEAALGNTAAFRHLYDQTKGEIFRFIRTRVNTREDALDLLQDTYIDLWQSLKNKKFTYTSDAELMSFIYTVGRRKVHKLYRFSKPHASLEDFADIAEVSDEEAGEAAYILQALDQLSSEDEEVLKLHYFSGLKFSEIASLQNKGESAIKVRHHRALQKLKDILGYEK